MSDKDIVEEAKEGYQEAKQSHEELKNALVEEHGSPYVEVEVDLGTGEEIPFSGRAGGSLIELIGQVSRLLNDPRMQRNNGRGPQADENEIMELIADLTGGVDGVCGALGDLCDESDMGAEWFKDLYRTDLMAFLKTAQKVYTQIQEAQNDKVQSFPGDAGS